jgi:hypothetical protein
LTVAWNSRNWNRSEKRQQSIRELSNRDLPGGSLEAQVKDYKWGDTVDSTVENPSFNREREHREREIRAILEEDMRHKAIIPAFPLCEKLASNFYSFFKILTIDCK